MASHNFMDAKALSVKKHPILEEPVRIYVSLLLLRSSAKTGLGNRVRKRTLPQTWLVKMY